MYDLPGQKRDSPEEVSFSLFLRISNKKFVLGFLKLLICLELDLQRDPLRIFYETLYNQVPSSEMAAIW